jgi:hypothetical protein
MVKRAFFIIIGCLFSFCSVSQKKGMLSNKNWYVKAAANYGVILQHRAIMGNLIVGNVPMAEINLVKPSDGSKLWQLENNKPDYGLSFSFIDFGNPAILGQCYSLAPFVEIPYSKKEKASRLIMRIGWGVSYITKKFDIETNHKNIAIGSHWNAFVQLRWQWNFNIGKKFRVEPGFTLSHTSDGRGAVPNLGLNIATLNLGLTYKINDEKVEVDKIDSSTKVPSKHEALFWYSFGFNETGNPNGPKYNAHTLSLNYYFNLHNRNKFGLGADVFYEELYLQDLKDNAVPNVTTFDKIRIGPKLSYAYCIGRISLPIEFGCYAGARLNPEGMFFHRLGIRYTGKNGLVVQFGLKTHWGVAYHFDYGIGYRLSFVKKNKL